MARAKADNDLDAARHSPRRQCQASGQPAPDTPSEPPAPPLVPVRIVNEYVYCPRLAYLEWVQGEWADNADTDEGTLRHRNVDRQAERKVDRPASNLPQPETLEDDLSSRARSVSLSAAKLGLTTRLDLVELDEGVVVPIEYKRGRIPDVDGGAYPPERVQLCAQGLVLRENGYETRHGFLYFVEAKRRIRVDFEDVLIAATLEAIDGAKRLPSASIPPPLLSSPKCPRCSLVGICLPDEVNAESADHEIRRLVPSRDDALPVYVQAHGAKIGVSGGELKISNREESRVVRLIDTSQVCILGNVQVTTPAVRALCGRGIPLCWFSYGGWFYGMTRGMDHRNVHIRIAQHRTANRLDVALRVARRLVRTKIRNTRVLLRRNHRETESEAVKAALNGMKAGARRTESVTTIGELLGVEGNAARQYFSVFNGMLKPHKMQGSFQITGRNRRPPTDPVNALLSFAYAMLAKDWTITLQAVGFDPYVGFLHQPRYGRPALALDLMEEFRPIVADSTVIWAINNCVIRDQHFVRCGPAVSLTKPGRSALIKAYERRMDELVTHPVFGYRISYRRVLEIQARLLGRYLEGEIDEYPPFEIR